MLLPRQIPITPGSEPAYTAALEGLTQAGIEFLIGGGFGLALYVESWRATKDLDVFIRPAALRPALAHLESVGFEVELTDPAWLGKARRDGALVDLIFCSYNGLFRVEDEWFRRARRGRLFGVLVDVMSPEEMILSKSFVAARDRFDGSDISWLIRTQGRDLDWAHIERRMESHWQVLLWQLIHCLYVFPDTLRDIPRGLLERLTARFAAEVAGPIDPPFGPIECRGPMLDPLNYKEALRASGGEDPRPRVDLIGESPGRG